MFMRLMGLSGIESPLQRFLQYPPPDVPNASGVDCPIPKERSPAVEAFKRSLTLGQECQASLVNYSKLHLVCTFIPAQVHSYP
jgi:hypothetical protein